MTHDELLEKLKPLSDFYDGEVYGVYNALRAVVELHKPNKYYPEFCDVCWWEEHERETYPCQTIQAIEKALK